MIIMAMVCFSLALRYADSMMHGKLNWGIYWGIFYTPYRIGLHISIPDLDNSTLYTTDSPMKVTLCNYRLFWITN